MADTIQADPMKVGRIAQKLVAVLINEDSATRQRAIQAAQMLLGDALPARDNENLAPQDSGVPKHTDLTTFFNREEELTPSENAQLCAAYHFALHGAIAFSVEELRGIAKEAGVVLPDRLDKTLASSTRDGRKLFQHSRKGMFRPTASAGIVFRERWGVRPGNKPKRVPVATP